MVVIIVKEVQNCQSATVFNCDFRLEVSALTEGEWEIPDRTKLEEEKSLIVENKPGSSHDITHHSPIKQSQLNEIEGQDLSSYQSE